MLKMSKTNLYSAIKSEDSEALDGRTSQLSSQREYGVIKNVLRRFLKALSDAALVMSVMSAGRLFFSKLLQQQADH